MPRSANAARIACEVSGEGGMGVPKGHRDFDRLTPPPSDEVIVQQQRRLAGSGRTLEGLSCYPNDDRTPLESRE